MGDVVRINGRIRPRYLAGLFGTVTEVDGAAATVRLQHPIGRFESGEVRCPPLALDKLAPAGQTASRV